MVSELKRVRKEDDGSETIFYEHVYEGDRYPYRAEVLFASLDEVRAMHRQGRVFAVRMSNVPEGNKAPQINLVNTKEIKGL